MQDKATLYARWLSGEITPEELSALEQEGAIKDLERIARTSAAWKLPKYDTARGLKTYHGKYPAKEKSVRSTKWVWLVVIAVSIALLYLLYLYAAKDTQDVLMADRGENRQVQLVDGSTVLINDGSRISYSHQEWEADRTIELTGEAFFKASKGSVFVVNTKNGSVEVLGTAFNVRAWGDNLYVECYEGRVKVQSGDKQIALTQQESVNFIDTRMLPQKKIIHQSPLWTDGTSRFHEEKMTEVFREVERQYDVTIQSPVLEKTFSGAFEHDNLEKALLNICKPVGLSFDISQDKKVISIE